MNIPTLRFLDRTCTIKEVTGIRCRVVRESQEIVATGQNTSRVDTEYTVYVPAGTDVSFYDLISNIQPPLLKSGLLLILSFEKVGNILKMTCTQQGGV